MEYKFLISKESYEELIRNGEVKINAVFQDEVIDEISAKKQNKSLFQIFPDYNKEKTFVTIEGQVRVDSYKGFFPTESKMQYLLKLHHTEKGDRK